MRTVFFLSCLILTGCRVNLVSGLDEKEANYFLYHLISNGVDAEKKEKNGRYTISVSKPELVRSLEITNQLVRFTRLSEVNKKGSRFSKEEELYYLERMISRQLEETLENLQFVIKARVHIYSPNYESLSLKQLERENSSAAVLLASDNPEKINVQVVRSIVSGATGLPDDKIRVEVSYAPKFLISRTETKETAQAILGHEKKTSKLTMFVIASISGLGLLGAFYVIRKSSRV